MRFQHGRVFRTPLNKYSELVRPADVALEVDNLGHHKGRGWSVIVYGRANAVAAQQVLEHWETDDLLPRAPGVRNLFIQITPSRITSCLLQRAQ